MTISLHFSVEKYQACLLHWYDQHGRHDLPWQAPFEPYKVWLSEIMLQQTQVKTVIPYFLRFIEKFPTIKSLANADIDAVTPYWAGLGYYARVRNLHKAAQTIMRDYNGRFPSNVAQIESLSGVGKSTAHAVASIAFGQPTPIMDGNVKRVFARLFMLEDIHSPQIQAQLWDYAERLMPNKRTQAYTQAQMDLGATICTRTKPKCLLCPLSNICQALLHDKVAEYPHKKKAVLKKQQHTVFYIYCDGRYVILEKRPIKGIWAGLYVLPQQCVDGASMQSIVINGKHIFTHIELRYDIELIKIDDVLDCSLEGERVLLDDLRQYAMPAIFQKLFADVDLIAQLKLIS